LFVFGIFVVGFILDHVDSDIAGQSITGQSINDESRVVSVSEGGAKNAGLFERVSSFVVESVNFAVDFVPWVYIAAAAVALVIFIFAVRAGASSRDEVDLDAEFKRINADMKKVERVIKGR